MLITMLPETTTLSHYGGLMIKNYYTKAKLTQIVMDLIYLSWEMRQDGNVDRYSLQDIDKAIDILKYYLQFLPKNND